jgi:N-acetylglucosaminyldiphosphoundecaprenol N-acetyl-beta-D-mannosaminyltransferase
MSRINFLNIPIDAITMKQTLSKIEEAIVNGKQIHHSVVNAIKITKMQSDIKLRESVLSADLINADGQSIVWAAKLLGKKIPERVTGIDLMEIVDENLPVHPRLKQFGASALTISRTLVQIALNFPG